MKKILFVINSLGLGGAEKSLTSLLNAFDFTRYEVDLLMFRPSGMFMELLPEEVHILPELLFLKSNKSLTIQLKNPKYLIARIRATIGLRQNSNKCILHDAQCYWKYAGNAFNELPGAYDVAIAWGQGNPTHYVAEKVNAKRKIAFVNADYEAAGHNRNFDHIFYEQYDYIAAVSDKLAEIMKNVFPDMENKIVTVYDINNAALINQMAKIENPFVNVSSDLIVVTVGRLVKPKGYDLAIQASKILKDKGIDFKWYFVGDGPERLVIEQDVQKYNLQENIILTGAQSNPYTYIKNADIYVQTSRFEGYCLTLGEARILNKPVISTNFEVVYNQIRDGENGLIVEMDPQKIADAIIRLFTDKELRNNIVENLKQEKKGNIEEIEKLYLLLE